MSDLVGIRRSLCVAARREARSSSRHLPKDAAARDRVLLARDGLADVRQIDGLAAPTRSPAGPRSCRSPRARVSMSIICSRRSISATAGRHQSFVWQHAAGVAPFRDRNRPVSGAGRRTHVMIYNVNTEARIEAIVQTPGRPDASTAAMRASTACGHRGAIVLNFMDVGRLDLRQAAADGNTRDVIDGIE